MSVEAEPVVDIHPVGGSTPSLGTSNIKGLRLMSCSFFICVHLKLDDFRMVRYGCEFGAQNVKSFHSCMVNQEIISYSLVIGLFVNL